MRTCLKNVVRWPAYKFARFERRLYRGRNRRLFPGIKSRAFKMRGYS